MRYVTLAFTRKANLFPGKRQIERSIFLYLNTWATRGQTHLHSTKKQFSFQTKLRHEISFKLEDAIEESILYQKRDGMQQKHLLFRMHFARFQRVRNGRTACQLEKYRHLYESTKVEMDFIYFIICHRFYSFFYS